MLGEFDRLMCNSYERCLPFDYLNLVYVLNIHHPSVGGLIPPFLVDDLNKHRESPLGFW